MPTTWALRLSNFGRSSWRAATSRVQVGVNAPMNPTSTTLFLPAKSFSASFSWVVAGKLQSGAWSPTASAATGPVDANTRAMASSRNTPMRPLFMTVLPEASSRLFRRPFGDQDSALHQRLHELHRLLAVPVAGADRAPDHQTFAVHDHGHRDPADAVLPRDRHPGIEQRRQPEAVLFHERLHVLLASPVDRHEIDDQVLRKARLQALEALELAGARLAPRGAEAQHRDLAGELF